MRHERLRRPVANRAARGAGRGAPLPARRPILRALLLGSCALAAAAPLVFAPAQALSQSVTQDLRDSQQRLEQIRQERQQLQREMDQIRSHVRDASREVANVERQVETSIAALQELDYQSALLAAAVDSLNRELVRTRDQLKERNTVLAHRLRSAYKGGPLHTVRVLLSATSFGDLLNRYKYLHLVTLSDQMLLRDVQGLEGGLERQEREVRRNLGMLEQLRADQISEVARLEQLEEEAQRTLQGYRQRERRTESRLDQLRADERRIADAIADLERRRVEDERRRVVAGGSSESEGSISTGDLGSLNWPVEGRLVYRFGPERRPNGVELRWNGIGIAAPAGTPVRAVEAGSVVYSGTFEGYGRSVWISHGGGYYTLYLHLSSVDVAAGDQVSAGQLIGKVGGESTPEGPHMEFQVRVPRRGGIPEPVDPLGWLRSRSQ